MQNTNAETTLPLKSLTKKIRNAAFKLFLSSYHPSLGLDCSSLRLQHAQFNQPIPDSIPSGHLGPRWRRQSIKFLQLGTAIHNQQLIHPPPQRGILVQPLPSCSIRRRVEKREEVLHPRTYSLEACVLGLRLAHRHHPSLLRSLALR